MNNLSRRDFVKLGVVSGVGLSLGACIESDNDGPFREVILRPLIHIDTDSRVTLFAQNPEMGQGVKTSLPMIIAEELDVLWSSVNVEQADWDATLTDQFSGGSLSVRLNFNTMRQLGASARQMLLLAAAERWHVPAGELRTGEGHVLHAQSDRRLPYGALAESAALLPVPDDPPLKSASDFQLVGRSIGGADTRSIVTGSQPFSLDVKLPGMLYVVVRRSPYTDGQPASFDDSEALKVNGVMRCLHLRNDQYGGRVVLPNSPNFVSGVAVLANSTWAAMQGARRLAVEWEKPDDLPDSCQLAESFAESHEKAGEVIRNDGDTEAVTSDAAVKIESTYRLPYLAHVPMEPMNCTVDASGDQIVVWAPTQNPGMLAETLAAVLKAELSSITVHVLRAGGAFGRRFYADFVVDATILSRNLQRPVKVVWPREDDVRHDYFRPASLQRIKASVDADGRINSWQHKMTSYSRMSFLEREGSLTELDNYEFPAGFVPNLRYE